MQLERAVSAGDTRKIWEKLTRMYGFQPGKAPADVPLPEKAVDKGVKHK